MAAAEAPQPERSEQVEDGAEERLATARGRLADRGLDPDRVIGRGNEGNPISVAGFYGILGIVGATEKAGQSPTYALARLALCSELPSEIAETLFLAYNQQSAEEAGHGDKVFGNAYFAMGGVAPDTSRSVVGQGVPSFLLPSEDPKDNQRRLGRIAGVLGGIETGALHRVFPLVVGLCERWDHPIGHDLRRQIQETVRPEEARHVLIWRYVFHTLFAPAGEEAVTVYYDATNGGRQRLGMPPLPREEIARMLGSSAPTPRQLLGKDRVAVA
jgi:hypothetical protein